MKQLSPLASLLILSVCFVLFVAGALIVYKRERPEKRLQADVGPSSSIAANESEGQVQYGSIPVPSESIPVPSELGTKVEQNVATEDSSESSTQIDLLSSGHSEWVGSESCGKCHASILESYKKHPMYYGSTRLVENDRPAPPEAGELTGKLKTLKTTSSEGVMFHSERVFDDEGVEIFNRNHPMKYVVGSGRRAKAYIEQRGELLCLSPLNWFGKTNSWGLNPGYSVDDPRGFDRKATANCMLCHAGIIKTQGPNSDLYQKEPFGELEIGCERCHGAGKPHIEFHELNKHGIDPIVNPESLDEPARQAVCYQCHLQPSAARILKEGRSHQDFQPGMRLDDVWLVLDTESGVDRDGRTKSVRHVQQMHDSQCFKKSGTMRCTTCHDPHSVPNENERITFYRDACIKCHDGSSGAIVCSESIDNRTRVNDSCYECHMPSRELDLSSHASQSDHRIIRRPESELEINNTPPSDLRFFGDLSESVSEDSRRRAKAIYSMRNTGPSAELYQELQYLSRKFPDDGMTWLSYGLAAMSRNDAKTAIDAWTKAASYDESSEFALEALIQMSQRVAAWDKTIEFSERLIQINPYHNSAYSHLADAMFRMQRISEALEAAKKGVELDPLSLASYRVLIDAHRLKGDLEGSQEWTKIRDRISEKLQRSK
ncbi:MAG: cytochrome c3 family protein [Pirellula sp.]